MHFGSVYTWYAIHLFVRDTNQITAFAKNIVWIK